MLWKWLLRISNGFGPSKTDLITKIRPHFTIKLFEDEEWKWPYFLDLVIFWWWKCCFNCLKIGPTLGPEGARDWNQMRWDQVSGTHFGHIYPLFNPFWNLKKLTPPSRTLTHSNNPSLKKESLCTCFAVCIFARIGFTFAKCDGTYYF